MNRIEILETALKLTAGDRNNTYGDPYKNLNCFARLIDAYFDGLADTGPIDAVDASIIMALAKISRVAANKFHMDNYVDGAAYMSIAGECAERIGAPK